MVTPTTSWPVGEQPGGGDRRVDPARHGDQHLHAAAPCSAGDGGGDDTRARGRRRRRWWSSPATGAARHAPAPAGRPWPPARATPAAPRWRTTTPPRRTPRPRRAGTAATRSRCPAGTRGGCPATDRPARHRTRRHRSRPSPGTAASRPSARRSRSRRTLAAASSRPRQRGRRAAAKPTMPATSCVPLRSSRSWPPPSTSGRSGVPRRTTSAPTPCGPPTLCELRLTRCVARQQVGQGRARRPPAPRRCGPQPGACAGARPRRPRRPAGWCRPRCWRPSPTRAWCRR